MKEVSYEGYTIFIGENAEENQHLYSIAMQMIIGLILVVIQVLMLLSVILMALESITKLLKEPVVLSNLTAQNVSPYPNCNSTCVAYLISSQQIPQAW